MACLNVKILIAVKNMMEVMDLEDFVVKNAKAIIFLKLVHRLLVLMGLANVILILQKKILVELLMEHGNARHVDLLLIHDKN